MPEIGGFILRQVPFMWTGTLFAAPSPVAGVYGAALNIGALGEGQSPSQSFSAGMTAFCIPVYFTLNWANMGVETVTATVTVTFDDGTTAQYSTSRSTNGTAALNTAAIAAQLTKSGHNVANIALACQSTIPNSTAQVNPSALIAMQTF
jgi:hypothetical protein